MNYDVVAKKIECVNAMKMEMTTIQNRIWELIHLPNGKKKVRLKWVFKTKYNSDVSIHKHKTRLVAKGYSQKHGVDFEEVFSHTARLGIVRTFLAMTTQLKWLVF